MEQSHNKLPLGALYCRVKTREKKPQQSDDPLGDGGKEKLPFYRTSFCRTSLGFSCDRFRVIGGKQAKRDTVEESLSFIIANDQMQSGV